MQRGTLINIKLLLAYDGTNYLGWQKTSMGLSIEEVLQCVLEKVLQEKVILQAASRTDAGVHASGQVVNFLIQRGCEKIEKRVVDEILQPTAKCYPNFSRTRIEKLKRSLNSLLPKDIAVLELTQEEDAFHATLDCLSKEYHYHLCYGPVQSPLRRLYEWHFPRELDFDAMEEAASFLVGEHDFSAFCNMRKNLSYQHYIRKVKAIELEKLSEDRMLFRVSGNNFLYKMVRNLVGTLVYVGCGKISADQIQKIMQGHNRTQAGITAPSCGLFLHSVSYSPN